jgi:hypothetical protein
MDKHVSGAGVKLQVWYDMPWYKSPRSSGSRGADRRLVSIADGSVLFQAESGLGLPLRPFPIAVMNEQIKGQAAVRFYVMEEITVQARYHRRAGHL